MNFMVKAGGGFAFAITIITIIAKLWTDAPSLVAFIAQNSGFFYGLAAGIAVAGLSKNIWLILIVIAAVFLLLRYVGF
jgi:hypothetical protein